MKRQPAYFRWLMSLKAVSSTVEPLHSHLLAITRVLALLLQEDVIFK